MTALTFAPRIGVVLEAFGDSALGDVLAWLQREVPEVTDVEVGAGGYAPHPHCDVALLLASAQSRAAWLDQITAHELRVGALNAWGNPLHPDEQIAQRHDADLRNAIRLATLLGVDRVVAMAGCPAADPRDKAPHFGAGGWLPYLEDVYERQWEHAIGPYWADLAAFAAAENPDLLVCLELHPGTAAFNVETFERVAGLGASLAANLDPSHFFWMGMDGHKVAERLGGLVGHSHGKDTVFHADSLALNGLLDRRWPKPAEQMPWNFAVAGRGHDTAWWTGLMRSLATSRVQVVSIEHEDPFVPPEVGIPEAARLLKTSIEAAGEVAA
jgi:sugar phosphate isomerase/epimerase